MSGDIMEFPDTVEEFMEEYKMIDKHEIYSNGIEYVPIFRMEQWFEHCRARSANAKRYIDAGEIEKYMNREEWKTPDEKWWPEREIGIILDAIPTADVVPVVHGVWLEDSDGNLICSKCKFKFYPIMFKFCPNCGADMRLKGGTDDN